MVTSRLITLLFVSLVLVPGCANSDKEKGAGFPSDGRADPKTSRSPYFPGLIEEYRNLLAEDPDNLAAVIALGNTYLDAGRWRDAIVMYERALSISPRNAEVVSHMGAAYRGLGMTGNALAEYRRALSYEPDSPDARFHLGILYAEDLKDPRSAVRVWEEFLRFAPNHPHAATVRSRIALLKGAQ